MSSQNEKTSSPPRHRAAKRRPAEAVGAATKEGLLTISAAVELLGVSESTLWRLIRRGALPSVLQGGRRLIPREALASVAPSDQNGGVPPFGPDHPIFRLVGAGKSGGLEPGARDKYSILAP